MKKVTLDKLTYDFRGQSQSWEFDPMTNTLAGCNGSGKTTAMNAFLWLLTSYDIDDNQNSNLFDNNAPTEPENPKRVFVAADFTIDGIPVSLKKTATQKWHRPKGKEEWERNKDAYTFYKDDLEISATAYTNFVEDTFGKIGNLRLMLNTDYWTKLDEKFLRNKFLEIVGEIKDEDFVQADYSEVKPLIAEVGTEKARKTFNNRLSNLKEAQTKQQAEIKATQDSLPDMTAVESAKNEIAILESVRNTIDSQLLGYADSNKAYLEKRNAEEAHIRELESRLRQAKFDYESEQMQQERVLRDNHQRNVDHNKYVNQNKSLLEKRIEDMKLTIDAQEARINAKLEDCKRIRTMQYDGTCPCCGNAYTGIKRAEALQQFQTRQAAQLQTAISEGTAMRETQARNQEELAKMQGEYDGMVLVNVGKSGMMLNSFLDNKVKFEDTEEYKEAQEEIAKLRSEVTETPSNPDSEQLQLRKGEVNTRLQELYQIVALEKIHADITNNIAQKTAELKQTVSAIATNERLKMLVETYIQEQSEIIRIRANKLFDRVTIEMTEVNKSGGIEPCCKLRIDGVVDTANTASDVWIGYEVSKAFQTHYKVCLPLFIDRAESLNMENTPRPDGQLILLKVDEGELRLEK